MTPGLVLLVSAAVSTWVGWLIGKRKGYPSQGLVAGLVLGWIGVVAIALWKPSHDELVRRARERLAIEREAQS
jgi:hypothetical protein